MKIGILTFHRALNYGAVLQCYALQETLISMGHDVEVIDYRPAYIEKYRKPYSKFAIAHREGIKDKIKEIIAGTLLIGKKRKGSKAFDSFMKKYLHVSSTLSLPLSTELDYDVVVVGSDQVWSPQICFGFDPVYWGEVPGLGKRYITYSASMGGHNVITDEMWKDVKSKLANYRYISVREKQLQDNLLNHCCVDVPVTLDPTLLPSVDVYSKAAIKPSIPHYVLYFCLENEPGALDFAKRIARQMNMPIVRVAAQKEFQKGDEGVIDRYSVTPQEFLGYFKYADVVVTISFHGTVFSTIFKKDFYSLKNPKQDRALNLLRPLGLESRLVAATDNVEFNPVDYDGVEKKLAELRESSLDYLKGALS